MDIFYRLNRKKNAIPPQKSLSDAPLRKEEYIFKSLSIFTLIAKHPSFKTLRSQPDQCLMQKVPPLRRCCKHGANAKLLFSNYCYY